MYKKTIKLIFIIVGIVFIATACEKKHKIGIDEETDGVREISKDEVDITVIDDKGYDLPVDSKDKEVMEEDCIDKMRKIQDIYRKAEKGNAINFVISSDVALDMIEVLKDSGYPVTSTSFSLDMYNYEKMEEFLNTALNGEKTEIDVYEVTSSGGINKRKFQFDGTDMYELFCCAVWSENDAPIITITSYTRLRNWSFTEKGWFRYEYCVPEPPEVTEVVNGNAMMRVRPLKQEYRDIAEKYLQPLGYQGNNLLCSNWNIEHMENIDYNGAYSYLYKIKYQEKYEAEHNYSTEIPREDFENLIMEFLPVTREHLEQFAVYNEETQTFAYTPLGCGNYTPSTFGTSFPEVTDVENNDDGTMTWTIDAVCEMQGNDAVISHKLTVKTLENGGIRYFKNEILGDGLTKIPPYQYRFNLEE